MGVAWAAVTLAAYLALRREERDPLLGFVILAACVTYLAVVAESRAHDRRRTETGRVEVRVADAPQGIGPIGRADRGARRGICRD
jgi:hypothetical protein